MPRPPPCPKCRSRKCRRIVYGEPDAEMGKRAEQGEIILGGCIISDNDPKWDCPDCRTQFGATKVR